MKRDESMKKYVKKLSALVMTAWMLCVAMTACGGEKTEETSAKVNPASGIETVEDGILKVGMECSHAPYNWTQSTDENGAVKISGSSEYAYGYDVMMAKYIAEQLGLELEIVKLDWDSLVSAVQSGTVDCVIAGQSMTAERLLQVDFTEPYFYTSIVALVKTDGPYAEAESVEELKDAVCTSQKNTVWYDTYLPQIPNANILPAQEAVQAMLAELSTGKCDVVVTDRPTAMAALIAYPDFKLLDFSGTEGAFEVSDEDIHIGISLKKDSSLTVEINKLLDGFTENDYVEMMNEAISVQPLVE